MANDTTFDSGLPFSAIVGQAGLKAALVLNVVDPLIGGVLIRGEPGTGKSTAVRAMRALLPDLTVVTGCPFNCDPGSDTTHCPSCQERAGEGARPVTRRPVPLVTMPIGATEDRLLGSLDLAAATRHGEARLAPGLVAGAHRGILYIDEVNLAADHLLDALLDVASSGIHRVERDGVSVAHAARFTLVGTMNPGEGALRPQILDRFGLCVDSQIIREPAQRSEVLARWVELTNDPDARLRYRVRDRALEVRIVEAQARLASVRCVPKMIEQIGKLVAEVGVASHRADRVLWRTALASAALGGRATVSLADLAAAATNVDELLRAWGHPWTDDGAPGWGESGEPAADDQADGHLEAEPGGASPSPPGVPPTRRSTGLAGIIALGPVGPGPTLDGERSGDRAAFLAPVRLEPPAGVSDSALHRRAGSEQALLVRVSTRHGGQPLGRTSPAGVNLALASSVLTSARRHVGTAGQLPLRLELDDLVWRGRAGRPAIAWIFVVDASWSMAMDGRFARTKAFITRQLESAPRGDRAAMIVVGGARAATAVPLTKYLAEAVAVVEGLRPRGRTPLADGLDLALDLCAKRWLFQGGVMPVVVAITDGRDNLRAGAASAVLAGAARRVRRLMVRGVVVAPSARPGDAASARTFAERMSWHHRLLPAAESEIGGGQ
jgi:magnesium chelatase subunit D